jgi:methyl-accepting chemotaxis protein
LPGIIKGFYGHLRTEPDLIKMFRSEAVLNHAAERQTEHWLNLFNGNFEISYFDSARRVGQVHSRIGLEPRYYIGGYAYTVSKLYDAAAHSIGSRLHMKRAQNDLAELLRALNQAVMLDMDLAISIYLEENDLRHRSELENLASAFEASVKSVVSSVATSAREMELSAKAMENIAEETGRQAVMVAGASEEASTNVATVAAASEELASSISEIGRQISQSVQVASAAVQDSEQTDAKMNALVVAAQKIGEVISLINNIAGQTNLLALNATIEAARAGDQGKGFAVVASEVKSLAGQTARATEEIRRQIEDIQNISAEAAQAIQGITKTIREMNEITAAISAAVEEQSFATQEIARSVQQAAAGTNDVASNITGVTQAAGRTGETADHVLRTSASLAKSCDHLGHEVDNFLSRIKVA